MGFALYRPKFVALQGRGAIMLKWSLPTAVSDLRGTRTARKPADAAARRLIHLNPAQATLGFNGCPLRDCRCATST